MANLINILDEKFDSFNWNYKRVLNSSHRYTCTNKIKIAILDGGVNKKVNFYNKIYSDKIFTDSANYISDHGLQVVGVLDSLIEGAYIFPYVVWTAYEKNPLNLLRSILDATNSGVDVINISLGVYKHKDNKIAIEAFTEVINYAISRNVVIVSSAGNDGLDTSKTNYIHLPSDHPGVISVGSTNRSSAISEYTNYGVNVNMYAPSGSINTYESIDKYILTYSTNETMLSSLSRRYFPNGVVLSGGTSLAVPHVTAAVAKDIDIHGSFDFNRIVHQSKKKCANQYCYREVRLY
ncbi:MULTISPECIES: S8 family peptidase [Staphylococcus]|uniref:Peptidase S8/S53 domain-containing protein n=2 Tax=Staphylococcus simulans TaxID=1286 RepID=A0ABP2YSK1_STASI|nr:S8 family serine peptidase [Staphylococcus simulans]ERS92465.1 hypothetical protein SSIM_12060 [Staphylococcus simulans UMC-CNS-990]MCE5150116.1 S8 family serine peptidase [Staphylococcus simulans]PTJ29589.1 hypothetical protein BU026_12670 [Staphylococcus simulans]RIN42395.1 hypothetical protein BU049_12860 [Staphylococcus simulans]